MIFDNKKITLAHFILKSHDLFCSFVEDMLIFFETKLVNKGFSWVNRMFNG